MTARAARNPILPLALLALAASGLAGCELPATRTLNDAIEARNAQDVHAHLFWRRMIDGPNRPIDKTGRHPLHRAAELGDLAVLKVLIDGGADINSLGSYGHKWTPMDYATSPEATEFLTLYGGKPSGNGRPPKGL